MTWGYYRPLRHTATAVRNQESWGTGNQWDHFKGQTHTNHGKDITTKQTQKDKHLSAQHGEVAWLLTWTSKTGIKNKQVYIKHTKILPFSVRFVLYGLHNELQSPVCTQGTLWYLQQSRHNAGNHQEGTYTLFHKTVWKGVRPVSNEATFPCTCNHNIRKNLYYRLQLTNTHCTCQNPKMLLCWTRLGFFPSHLEGNI